MKSLVAPALVLLLSGCQQLVLERACTRSAAAMAWPEEGSVAYVDVSFRIRLDAGTLDINERAICEYQGAICPAGEWYQVWYGDQSISHEFDLEDGERLVFWPHGACTALDGFRKRCAEGHCVAEEHFEFRLVLSEKRVQNRKNDCRNSSTTDSVDEFAKCAIPEVDSVTYSEIEEYGYELESYRTTVSGAEF